MMPLSPSDTPLGSGFVLISSTSGKPDPDTRRRIRRHVMRGKNTRRQGHNEDERQLLSNSEQWTLTSPRKITSELSLLTGVPYMQQLIYRAFTIVKPSTYRIEVIVSNDASNNMLCFSSLASNAALLHSVCFFAQAFHDVSRMSPLSPLAHLHLTKALCYLQQDLMGSATATSDATMTSVVSLATAAVILGDIDTVQKHIDGLHRIIQVRGGLETLDAGGMILHKATRLDFGLAMATRSDLRFMPKNMSWDPAIAQDVDARQLPELNMLDPVPDLRLLNIWADLRVFSRAANHATISGNKMPNHLFHRLATSVPARLFLLKGTCCDVVSSELLRLAMLAFMKTILVQIDGLGPRMVAMASDLKDTLLSKPACPSDLFLWTLFVSAISIFEDLDDHDWLLSLLSRTLSDLGIDTWPETRNTLKRFLWIDLLHNRPGEYVYTRFVSAT